MAFSIIQSRKEIYGGTKTLVGSSAAGISFTAWQTKDLLGIKHFFFNGSSSNPIEEVETGEVSFEAGNKPVIASLSGTVYSPSAGETDRPLTTQNQRYIKIGVVAANDGAKLKIGGQNLSQFNGVVIVTKSGQTSTAGKLKIRTTTGNESVCSFVTSATANRWVGGAGNNAQFFEFKSDGAVGVAHTGVFDATSVTELEITGDTLGTDISVYEVYFVTGIQQAIGYELAVQQACVDSMTEELSREMSDILCNQVANSSISTGDSYTITVTLKRQDLKVVALSQGDILIDREITIVKKYDTPIEVTTDTATYPNTYKISKVVVGETPLDRYYRSSDVPNNAYHDDENGTLTFNGLSDGTQITIFYEDTSTIAATVFKALEQGYYGFLSVPKISDNGVANYLVAKKAQMMLNSKSMADDGSTVEVQFKLYADNNGVYVTEAQE